MENIYRNDKIQYLLIGIRVYGFRNWSGFSRTKTPSNKSVQLTQLVFVVFRSATLGASIIALTGIIVIGVISSAALSTPSLFPLWQKSIWMVPLLQVRPTRSLAMQAFFLLQINKTNIVELLTGPKRIIAKATMRSFTMIHFLFLIKHKNMDEKYGCVTSPLPQQMQTYREGRYVHYQAPHNEGNVVMLLN